MAFTASALLVALIAVFAGRRLTRDMTGGEYRHRLRTLQKHQRGS